MMGLICASSSSPSSSSSSSSPRDDLVLQSVVDLSPPRFSSENKHIVSTENKNLVTHLKPKSSEELKREIASIELEILHMERYLLSLYRTAFEEQVPTFAKKKEQVPSFLSNTTLPCSVTTSPSVTVSNQFSHYYQASPLYQKPISYKALSAREGIRTVSGNHTLADLLGSSHIIENFVNPNKLSEDIIRCISSVYCTLSRTSRTNSTSVLASPLSSMSTSSSKATYDSWSLQCSDDNLLNQDSQEVVVIEALRVHLDDGSFSYAALMLQNFRSLVQNLEKVDLSRMKREEKLAFWINIHNALVMHAYLAYGTHSRARNTSVLKAAYDVGGYRVNPYIIQSSILGIKPHYLSPPLLQTLFSPSRKSKTCSIRHVYALEYPEALAHFSLSSGASTDPPVRVYRAESIFRDLRQAKEEFIRSNVRVQKGTKILLPKIFHHYAKDISLDVSKLMETTAECLPEDARNIAEKCLKEKKCKSIEWLSENLSFRYVIVGELAGGRIRT